MALKREMAWYELTDVADSAAAINVLTCVWIGGVRYPIAFVEFVKVPSINTCCVLTSICAAL